MRKAQLEAIIFMKKGEKIEFLILKRIQSKGGFWQPITGGWEEDDQSMLEGMLREVKEETGITRDSIVRIIDHVHHFEIDDHPTRGVGEKTKEYVFGIEVLPETIITMDKNIYPEHEAMRWTSLEEAMRLLKWQSNKDAFIKLSTMLSE